MELSIKELRIGFRLGIYNFDDVQSWVNSQISKTNQPSDEILDLAFTKRNQESDLYSRLSAMPNSEENDKSLISALSVIKESDLGNVIFCRDLAQKLYAYCVDRDYEVDKKLEEVIFFDDGYDLASQGIGDSIESWHMRFKEFIYELRDC